MLNDKRSYTEYTVTQPTTDFAIGFEDYAEGSKDNIVVSINGVLAEALGYAVLRKNSSEITITPAVATGTVRLQRETAIDEPFHKFTAGALFSAKSMDENLAQVRHSQQEVRDGFTYLEYNINSVVATAKSASAAAVAATAEAVLAKNTAVASATRAETATATANVAAGKVNTAIGQASEAVIAANASKAAADLATTAANTATTAAQAAKSNADTATASANTAVLNANRATLDAVNATTTALEVATTTEGTLAVVNSTLTAVQDVVATVRSDAVTAVNNAINNTAVPGGILADTFVTVTANGVGAVARSLRDVKSERISIKDFGAKGDGDETLMPVTPYKTGRDKMFTISQQTVDGDAFNKAIRYLRSKGGGALYLPTGKYKAYGYLEQIDFPCIIYGDGGKSELLNCVASPTNTHGYGLFVIQPKFSEEVGLLNFRLDGVADNRAMPTGELQLYNLVVYGMPRLMMYGIISENSAIDCFNVSFDRAAENPDTDCYAKVVNCHFNNCFRNSLTVARAKNVEFVNCTAMRGGFVHGGTNPRYCLDIEPNTPSVISQARFTNCVFSHGRNVLAGGVWSDSMFSGCTFDGSYVHPDNLLRPNFPWLFNFTAGQWELDNCKFIGRKDYMENQSYHYNLYGSGYNFTDDAYLRIKNSTWIHCGFTSTGRSVSIENCFAQMSMCPFSFSGGTLSPTHDLFVKGLRLSNVFDGANYGLGAYSSFNVANSMKGVLDIDGLTVEVDSRTLSQMPKSLFKNRYYHGINLPTPTTLLRKTAKNIHAEGYYKRLNTYLEQAETSAYRRDWRTPSTAPENTAIIETTVNANLVDGTVTTNVVTNKAVVGTGAQKDVPANRIVGGRTGYYWRNCTMWGNFD